MICKIIPAFLVGVIALAVIVGLFVLVLWSFWAQVFVVSIVWVVLSVGVGFGVLDWIRQLRRF